MLSFIRLINSRKDAYKHSQNETKSNVAVQF